MPNRALKIVLNSFLIYSSWLCVAPAKFISLSGERYYYIQTSEYDSFRDPTLQYAPFHTSKMSSRYALNFAGLFIAIHCGLAVVCFVAHFPTSAPEKELHRCHKSLSECSLTVFAQRQLIEGESLGAAA